MAGSPSSQPSAKFSKRPPLNPRALIVFIALAICVAGIVQFNRPYPSVEVKPTSPTSTLPGHFSVTFPEQGESALGTDTFGVIASSPDQTAVPIASVTKIMTAYLVLKAHPLQPGEDGPALTMNAQDVSDYVSDSGKGYSVLPIAPGEKLTEKQLLEGLMLPSGDNIASTLGRWISGSDAAFVAKMNETVQSLGMTKTHYADASGVSPSTVSNAVDQIKIAQVAMENPVFRAVVAMPQVTLPVAGTVFNVDGMLGKHGIVGIKTGSTLEAGGCFVSATPVVVGGETHYIIGAVLGQKTVQSLQSALNANANILDQVRSEFKLYNIEQPTTGFGQIVDAWHSNSVLTAQKPIQIFGYPGMNVSSSINLLHTQLPLSSGDNIAALKIQSGQAVLNVPLQSSQPINPPGFLWRLFRN
jgi:D-alanyl-D-alanine carboxypeptidase (penicillin-binding protein 5/6)